MRSAQNVEIDPLGELSRIRALLDDVHRFEFIGIEHKLLLEVSSNGMVMVSMTAIHSGEILHGSLAAVARIHRSSVGGIARDPVCRLQYRSSQSGRDRQFASEETAAYRKNAT